MLTLGRDLRRRKGRERQGLFVAEGLRAVTELLDSPLRIRGALISPDLAANPRAAELRAAFTARGVEVAEVTADALASAANTDSPQGVLAIASIPERSLEMLDASRVTRLVVLDALQDPGNVGTVLRTAAALGASATVALPGTVDLWNAKVVRSAMGAHFRHPAFHCTWDDLHQFLERSSIPLWAADAGGTPLATLPKPPRLALAVGNEGAGLSSHLRSRADTIVSLPLDAGVESLNVAVACGILLYELRP